MYTVHTTHCYYTLYMAYVMIQYVQCVLYCPDTVYSVLCATYYYWLCARRYVLCAMCYALGIMYYLPCATYNICCTIPCHYLIVPCHTIPYHVLSYQTVQYHTVPYHTVMICANVDIVRHTMLRFNTICRKRRFTPRPAECIGSIYFVFQCGWPL